MAKCCSNCFNDKLITAYIKKESEEYGNCSFCGSRNVQLVEPENFTDTFEVLLNLYKESDNPTALPLYKLIQKDWSIFSSLNIAEHLIPQILDYTNGKFYEYFGIDDKFVANLWDEFRYEIKHNNRFFQKSQVNINELQGWIQELYTNKYPTVLFRARICEDKVKIKKNKMGKPPLKIATGGRANPVGISYLYVASDISTAIAEIRPHKSDFVSVVKLKIPSNLKLVDLRNPKNSLSPFIRTDYNVEELFKYIELLQQLGEELSKPILPRDAHLEYLPSQYLAELIKDANFNGIIYKSSVGNGDNIALFSDTNVEFKSVELYEVKNLSFDSSKI